MNYSNLIKYNKGVLEPKNASAERQLKNYQVSFYFLDSERIALLKFAKKIKRQLNVLLDPLEICQLGMLVKNTEKIEGDIAEVGVYEGGSARVICEFKNKKKLYLFDTFEGLPIVSDFDKNLVIDKQYKKGQYDSDFTSVKQLFQTFDNVYIEKGIFPTNTEKFEKSLFSLVHLDVDVLESTHACLEFFYPKMSKGGVIVTHDYQSASGVRRAFDYFFSDKPEIIIELAVTQAMVVKL